MAFNKAHNFVIQGDVNQVEMSGRGNEMNTLVNAACPGASHESIERADPPRCHPDTRKEVITEIMNWVNSSDPEKRIMWLYAAAGAGKSAIAQTIADICDQEGKLLSSFFFSRTATGSGRDNGDKLIATIAYHLAVLVPEARGLILSKLERDPALFEHFMDVQLKTLVMDPVIHLESQNVHVPFLVIIDGLDECNDTRVQSRIISTIAKSVSETSSRVRFFFASRPERVIQKTFESPSIKNTFIDLTLKEDEQAIRDIEVYLRSEFETIKNTHSLAAAFPKTELLNGLHWPSDEDIWTLVNRSSGNFIYPSTVIKYIADDNRDPRDALHAIIHRSIMAGEASPLAELDALYIHILSTAASRTTGGYDAILPILQMMALKIEEGSFDDGIQSSPDIIAEFLGVTESSLTLRILHLHSIIRIQPPIDGQIRWAREQYFVFKFHHASFEDFLLDPSRSAAYFVDPQEGHIFLGRRCLALLSSNRENMNKSYPTVYAARYFWTHLELSKFSSQLINAFLHSTNVKSMVSTIINSEDEIDGYRIHDSLCSIFSFDSNFLEDFAVPMRDFAVPKVIETVEVCQRVSDALDESLLDQGPDPISLLPDWASVPDKYLYPNYMPGDAVPSRQLLPGKKGLNEWAKKIMDIPERGKHMYISDETAKKAILTMLGPQVSLRRCSFKVFLYFLKRVKPTVEFGSEIRNYWPDIKWFRTQLLLDFQKSELRIFLKKCGLEKELNEITEEFEEDDTDASSDFDENITTDDEDGDNSRDGDDGSSSDKDEVSMSNGDERQASGSMKRKASYDNASGSSTKKFRDSY